MDYSTPGFPVLHLPELAQTHVHWVSDAIQSSHPMSFPSPPAFNLSQYQGLFQWVSSLHQVAKVLGVSASASVTPMNIQDWYPLWLTGLISLLSKGLSRVFSNATIQKHQFFSLLYAPTPKKCSAFFMVQLSHPYTTNEKAIALTRRTFVGKVMSPLFNTLSRFVIAFLSRRKRLLISWLQSPSTMILEPKKIKVCHCFHCFPIYFPWNDGTKCHDLSFLNVKL